MDKNTDKTELADALRSAEQILAVYTGEAEGLPALSPALGALGAALPGVRFDLLAKDGVQEAADSLPGIGEVIAFGGDDELLAEELGARGYDAALIFTADGDSPYRSAYLCYLGGIPVRAAQSREFGGSLLSQWIEAEADGPVGEERHLAFLRALGLLTDAPNGKGNRGRNGVLVTTAEAVVGLTTPYTSLWCSEDDEEEFDPVEQWRRGPRTVQLMPRSADRFLGR
jgi:hypothetical protein